MPREVTQRIQNILEQIHIIQRYVTDVDLETFQSDTLRHDAVIWNFRMIGEAITVLPVSLQTQHPTIPWIALRELSTSLGHAYYDVPFPLVWSIATQELSPIIAPLEKIISDLTDPPTK
jgi:uncharacterized protein with HEPN domain